MTEDKTTDPLDTPLPCDVRLPGMVIGKGVALRVLVEAAARWKTEASAAYAKTLPPDAKDRLRDLLRRQAGNHAD